MSPGHELSCKNGSLFTGFSGSSSLMSNHNYTVGIGHIRHKAEAWREKKNTLFNTVNSWYLEK